MLQSAVTNRHHHKTMDSPGAARRPRAPQTPTCTVPGLLVSLTKLLNLTKVCAAPPPAPADDVTGEAAPAPTTTKPDPDFDSGPDPRLVLVRLFDAVSALKSGYVKLQRAHFPYYDADRVAAADEAVASELDSVAALRCLCASPRRGLAPLVDDRWAQAQRLEADARRRDARIAALRRELRRLQRDNARLSRQVAVAVGSRRNDDDDDRHGGRGVVRVLSVPREMASPPALVRQFAAASSSIAAFAELLLGNNGAAAAAELPEQCDAGDDADAEQARSWRRYALEAHMWRAMLLVGGAGAGDEEECCGGGGGDVGSSSSSSFRRMMKPGDALDALMQYPRSPLSAFCRAAYVAAVPAEVEAAAACGGRLDHRAFVSRGGHPRTPLYRAFADAARNVWAVRVLMTAVAARCSESELGNGGGGGGGGVRMFYAGNGSLYAPEFMEIVEARRVEVGEEEKVNVAFTVAPGVKVGDMVVRCRVVLLSRRRQRQREGCFVRIR